MRTKELLTNSIACTRKGSAMQDDALAAGDIAWLSALPFIVVKEMRTGERKNMTLGELKTQLENEIAEIGQAKAGLDDALEKKAAALAVVEITI
ncbi:MAG: hypothetical protein AAGU77_13850, partial [Bacillota bacterium]